MRYVYSKDVNKILLEQSRSAHWEEWAAKHEYEELQEGIWHEPVLALLRKKTKKDWTDAGCRKDSSTLVGQMKVSAKHVTRRKAQTSTGFTIAQNGTRSDGRSQRLSESGSKKREP